jgi:hypothetical protein
LAHPKNSSPAARRLRVRSRRLEQIDDAKLATAFAIMARRLLEQRRSDVQIEQADADARVPGGDTR